MLYTYDKLGIFNVRQCDDKDKQKRSLARALCPPVLQGWCVQKYFLKVVLLLLALALRGSTVAPSQFFHTSV